jgi:4-amino-4-deoxy-L-arabinose transferase-like glycosyltransferase
MKLLAHLKKYQELYALLLIAALARLLFFFDFHEIWWDSGVYVGMAKYLWSAGASGLWEHIRPILWPLVIGSAWWFKQDIVFFARILEFTLAMLSIVFVYALGKRWFSERTGILAAVIWAFSSIVFYLSFHEYTELPAIVLVLAALVAFDYERWFLAGLLASFAFLTKFPAGIFFVVLVIALLVRYRRKALLPFTLIGLGFALPTAAFLVFNQFMYGAMLLPLIDARGSILSVLGCNVLRFKPWWQYFAWIFADNWLNLFAILGIVAFAYRWKKQNVLPVLALAISALYFMQLHCREYRYLVLFLPFIVLFTGKGIVLVVRWLEQYRQIQRYAWPAVLVIVVAVSVFHGVIFYHGNEVRTPDYSEEQYYRWIADKHITGEIWSANPTISVYTDASVNKIYYPIYEQGIATSFAEYVQEHKQRIGAVLLDNCGGGIICPPNDVLCENQLNVTRAFLNEHFRQAFFAQSGHCWYAIYTH